MSDARWFGQDGLADAAALVAEAAARSTDGERAWSGATPGDLRAGIASLDPCPDDGQALETVLAELEAKVLAHGVRSRSPRTAAHLHSPVLRDAALAELLIGATNQSLDSFEQSPAATLVEDHLVGWLAAQHGLGATASGVLTAGGTASNLLGLTLAREARPERRRIVASHAAHDSIRRAAALLGLGAGAVVPVATTEDGALALDALDRVLDDVSPIAIVATAGTTDHGAIDPLDEVAERAGRIGAWLHVDAAVGSAFVLSDSLRRRLAGIERADSITVDLHKLWWQPIGASALLVADGASFELIRQPSDYLDRPEDDMLNLVGRSLDTSRRFDALKIMLSLRTAGRTRMAAWVEQCVALAAHAGDAIDRHPSLELVAPPQTITALFRRRDGDDVRAQRELFSSGRAVVGRTRVDGAVALKLTCVDPTMSTGDIDILLDLVAGA